MSVPSLYKESTNSDNSPPPLRFPEQSKSWTKTTKRKDTCKYNEWIKAEILALFPGSAHLSIACSVFMHGESLWTTLLKYYFTVPMYHNAHCPNIVLILYNYHHSTKLYRKISPVCCRLYCYKCSARVTMPMAINQWYFSDIAWYYGDEDFIIQTSLRIQTKDCFDCTEKSI